MPGFLSEEEAQNAAQIAIRITFGTIGLLFLVGLIVFLWHIITSKAFFYLIIFVLVIVAISIFAAPCPGSPEFRRTRHAEASAQAEALAETGQRRWKRDLYTKSREDGQRNYPPHARTPSRRAGIAVPLAPPRTGAGRTNDKTKHDLPKKVSRPKSQPPRGFLNH